jgi:hypothetical protein
MFVCRVVSFVALKTPHGKYCRQQLIGVAVEALHINSSQHAELTW